MKRCTTCERSLNFRYLRCQICKTFNWQPPHIIISAVLVLALTGGVILALDHLSNAESPLKSPSQVTQTSAPASTTTTRPRIQQVSSKIWKGNPGPQ